MKAINYIFGIVLLVILFQCQTDENIKYSSENEKFIRFSVHQTNGLIVNSPTNPSSSEEISSYTFDGVTVKLPVNLSQIPTSNTVKCNFSLNAGSLVEGVDYEIHPSNKILSFQGNQLSDSIVVRLLKRITSEQKIVLSLDNVSDKTINLGYPREQKNLKTFDLVFQATGELPITFDVSRRTITGDVGSKTNFTLSFPKGFLPSDFSSLTPFSRTQNYNYQLSSNTLNPLQLNYSYQFVNQTVLPIDKEVNEILTVNTPSGYTLGRNAILVINKEYGLERLGNPANNFFNVNDALNRNFGRVWIQYTPGVCSWRAFSHFVKPVILPDSEKGNPKTDKNNDGFHDFKLRLEGNSSPIGTNPFATQTFYTGASNVSPAFIIQEALEFFPSQTDPNYGTVNVIAQPLTLIKLSNQKAFPIIMSGGGTYKFNTSLNAWEMYLEVHYNETAIGGSPDAVHKMYIWNINTGFVPAILTESCIAPISI